MDGATDGGTDGTIIEGGAGGGSLEEDTLLIRDLDKCLNMLSGDFLILFWLLHLDDEVDDADDIPKKINNNSAHVKWMDFWIFWVFYQIRKSGFQ